MVKNNPDFDREKLERLGSLLYATGGKDVLEMAQQVLSGGKLTI